MRTRLYKEICTYFFTMKKMCRLVKDVTRSQMEGGEEGGGGGAGGFGGGVAGGGGGAFR